MSKPEDYIDAQDNLHIKEYSDEREIEFLEATDANVALERHRKILDKLKEQIAKVCGIPKRYL